MITRVRKAYLHGSMKPSEKFLREIKNLENVFGRVNGTEIDHETNLQKRLFDRRSQIDLPEKIKKFFFKCRIHFRIKS